MTITLTADVGYNDPTLHVSAPSAFATPFLVTIDAETIVVVSGAATLIWETLRGADTSGPSSHSAGAVVSPTAGAGGAALTVTDGVTTVDPTSGLSTPAGTVGSSNGTAQLRVAPMIVSDDSEEPTTAAIPTFVGPTDPTTIEALADLVTPGVIWIDTRAGPPYTQWVRANTEPPEWQLASLIAHDADGQARVVISPFAFFGEGGFQAITLSILSPEGSDVAVVDLESDGTITFTGRLLTASDGPIATQATDVPAAVETVTAADFNALLAAMRASQELAQTGTALAFDQDPTAALVDATITPAVTVNVLDDLGNVCTHDNATEVTLALTVPGGATLAGTLTQTAVDGVATFDDLSVDTANTYTLTASSGALADDESASFVISAL